MTVSLVPLRRLEPNPELVSELSELLAQAKSAELEYIAFVAVEVDGAVVSHEVGTRDAYHVAGRLIELSEQIRATENESDE